MSTKKTKIVITGGHHSSALPVIEILKKTYPQIEIYWFGHKHSLMGDKNATLEYIEITSLNIPFYEIQAGKVYRTFNLKRLLKVPFGFFQSLFYLIKLRPDMIMSFGGYIAVPTVIAGWLLGISSITHEQTMVTGYANKVISHFARRILISWPQSAKFFPKDKVVYTGIPLRSSIFKVTSTSFQSPNNLPTIYITAGKTGSHKINQCVLQAMPDLLKFCNVIHQCGDYSELNDYTHLQEAYSKISANINGKYYLRKFVLESEIGEAFNTAQLVVSRAGAHTISEILALEKPCILIPIPWVSHDEQVVNSRAIKDLGLAEVIAEDLLNSSVLVECINGMLPQISKYKVNQQSHLKDNNAAQLIVSEITKLLPSNINAH